MVLFCSFRIFFLIVWRQTMVPAMRLVTHSLENSQKPPSRTFGAERICSAPGCMTVLSKYNPADVCSSHGGWNQGKPRQERAVRHVQERTCLNPLCNKRFTTTNDKKKFCSDRCRIQASRLKKEMRKIDTWPSPAACYHAAFHLNFILDIFYFLLYNHA